MKLKKVGQANKKLRKEVNEFWEKAMQPEQLKKVIRLANKDQKKIMQKYDSIRKSQKD